MLYCTHSQHLLIHLNKLKMSKKIVLITGTNSGFGWLTAQSAAASGHQVYATMRDTQGRNADKAAALGALENITVLDVNLTKDESVNQAVETILKKEGRIDVLVNNAGYAMAGVAESFTTTDVHTTFDINVYAPWRLTKQVLPAMRNQADGLIINVTSGFGRVAFPFATIYAASKFALEGISEGLHYEVKRLGIDVAIVEPGAFPTEMQQKHNPASDQGVFEGYSAIAEIPNKMVAALTAEMQAKKPNPQQVADAIIKLIDTPKGMRPLRTVVDPITGQYIETANQAIAEQFAKGLTVFGMGELL
jgi:NAD(P)-dependent dehydrogenase (short-subunit alcohol dehydrogenase family)